MESIVKDAYESYKLNTIAHICDYSIYVGFIGNTSKKLYHKNRLWRILFKEIFILNKS